MKQAEKDALVSSAQRTLDLANAIAVDSAPTPPPAPPPPPPPGPQPGPAPTPDPASGLRINTSAGQADVEYSNKATYTMWKRPMGDIVDKNGVFNGPTPTYSATPNGPTLDIDIAGTPGPLLLDGLSKCGAIAIDGVNVTASCFWTDPTANRSLPLPSANKRPVVIPNTTGRVMRVTPLTGETFRVDRLALPVVLDYPVVPGGSPPTMLDLDVTSEAAVLAALSNTAQPYAFSPEYLADGPLRYVRLGVKQPGNDPRLTHWMFYFNGTAGVEEAYTRQLVYIEPDVWPALNELGVKLGGIEGGTPTGVAGIPEAMHFLAWHSALGPGYSKDAANPQVLGLNYYLRDVNTGPGSPNIKRDSFAYLRPGRWYCLEQHVKLNTPGVADGIGRQWVNGNLVFEDRARKWRNYATTKLLWHHAQIYHGGVKPWLAPVHYRMAKLASSATYIGVPAEMPR